MAGTSMALQESTSVQIGGEKATRRENRRRRDSLEQLSRESTVIPLGLPPHPIQHRQERFQIVPPRQRVNIGLLLLVCESDKLAHPLLQLVQHDVEPLDILAEDLVRVDRLE
jgi:hypothetical protein